MNFLHYIKKARTLQISEIVLWILRGLFERLVLLFDHVRRIYEPAMAERRYFSDLLKSYGSIDNIVSCIKKNLSDKYFISSNMRDEFIQDFQENFPSSLINQISNDAENIYRHTYDLLGSGRRDLGGSVNWCIDIATGRKWPLLHYTHCPLEYNDGSDIIRVWELSRFQWGPTLGKAFWLTGNIKYLKEFFSQINSWKRRNPYEFGPNWMSSQDVSIRSINWILTLCFFNEYRQETEDAWLKIILSLYSHGIYIERNLHLEYTDNIKTTGTHYLSGILGLLYLGLLFHHTPKGKYWLELSVSELISEIEDQTYCDGGDYESSIACYHRFALEHFISAWVLFSLNRINSPTQSIERLEKMIEYVAGYTRPDGKAPQIGDTNDGRVLILSNYSKWEKNDHRYLLQIGSVLFGRKDFSIVSRGSAEEAFWLLKRLQRFSQQPFPSYFNGKKNFQESISFPETGFYFMKKGGAYLGISSNHVGKNGKGNHKHNDIFSFELMVGNEAFLVDPGSYVYTSDREARNLFRSTRYHNTLVIDHQEINSFNPEHLFRMTENAFPKVTKWEVNEGYDYFEGHHYGYIKLTHPVVHERKIFFDKFKLVWLIQDSIYPFNPDSYNDCEDEKTNVLKNAHEIELNFHFAPLVRVEHFKKMVNHSKYFTDQVRDRFGLSPQLNDWTYSTIEALSDGKQSLSIQLISIPGSLELNICDGWVSPSYGVRKKAPIVSLHTYCEVPATFLYVMAVD